MDIRLCPPCGYAAPPPAVRCPHCDVALESRDETWLLGHTLGNYRIERIIGSGGMGVVFAARHQALLREAAIKVLQPALGDSDPSDANAFCQRFLQEARLLAALDHPGIIGIYDFSISSFGFPYLVMPLLHGETLRDVLRRHPKGLPEAWVAAIGEDLCAALAHAHAHGVVHRDLKPENVFLGAADGSAWTRLLDFGIAYSERPGNLEHASTGLLMGTPQYLAPEQLRGDPVSGATDQYSLALLLIELFSGRAVRAGQDLPSITHRYARQPLSKDTLPQGWNPDRRTALARATHPLPGERFDRLEELESALDLPTPDRQGLARALRIPDPAEATGTPTMPLADLEGQATTPLEPPATTPHPTAPMPAHDQPGPGASRPHGRLLALAGLALALLGLGLIWLR